MKNCTNVRIDKFLWAVRLYKTRALAAEACKKGKVLIDDLQVKPSRTLTKPLIFSLKKDNIIYQFQIIQLLNNRVAAKLVSNYIENITPKEEIEKLELDKLARNMYRNKGTGRPTKKERRDLKNFFEEE